MSKARSQGAERSNSPSSGPSFHTRPLIIKRVPISSVIPWEDNPRGIRIEDFDRLKRQILELGVYKPLLVVQEKGKYIVLGGNMRIRALKELGVREIEVSIVEAKTKAERIKYALSDNDRAGFYEEERLAELILPCLKDLNLADFKIDLGNQADLQKILEKFGPDLNPDEREVDDSLETTTECPKCGYKW
jgi:hypothetical protein